MGKTPSNISYLVQYRRLNRYGPDGRMLRRAAGGGLRVSRSELVGYFEALAERQEVRLRQLSIDQTELAFFDVPERERTKHVHRLHPYLGKFIPQLTEHFLRSHFDKGDVVVDPFCGSGTTLVQAAEMGIHSVGVDVSEFNVMISNVKLARYDHERLSREVTDALGRTEEFSKHELSALDSLRLEDSMSVDVDSQYLKLWFAERSLREMLFYRDIIEEYEYQDLLRVLLSRTIRSCRLTYHYELATPREPVRQPYVCHKHRQKVCTPVTTIIPRLRTYSLDTLRRIEEFSRLRGQTEAFAIQGDSRRVDLGHEIDSRLGRGWLRGHSVRGVLTSPPYIGQIDYHDQHRYAYELFGIKVNDGLEIGPKSAGKGTRAQADYVDGIGAVLSNVRGWLAGDANFLIVANDRMNLYPEIFRRAGLRIAETFQRPVEDRTERDKRPYSETVFMAKPD